MTEPLDLAAVIRTIPDYPKAGILFRDITTLLGNGPAFRAAVDALAAPYAGAAVDKLVAIEARGFILGGAVAHQLRAGFVPLRKPGKLPHATVEVDYALEYGMDRLQMHADALRPGERVLIVDDLIATGGTAEAALTLVRQAGAEAVAAAFVVDLPDLGGAERLRRHGVPVTALVSFPGH
jgi:adenine phosphoribosyltransferase